MKKSNDQKIDDVIKSWLQEEDLSDGYYMTQIKNEWNDIVGPFIAERTRSVKYFNNLLIVELNSSSLKHELQFYPNKIKDAVNEYLKAEAVTEVRVI